MSDTDKMMAFGHWLASRQTQLGAELFATSVNSKATVDQIRVKAGHLEAYAQVFGAFKELYNGDLNKFNQEYLGINPEEEDKDGPSKSPT